MKPQQSLEKRDGGPSFGEQQQPKKDSQTLPSKALLPLNRKDFQDYNTASADGGSKQIEEVGQDESLSQATAGSRNEFIRRRSAKSPVAEDSTLALRHSSASEDAAINDKACGYGISRLSENPASGNTSAKTVAQGSTIQSERADSKSQYRGLMSR